MFARLASRAASSRHVLPTPASLARIAQPAMRTLSLRVPLASTVAGAPDASGASADPREVRMVMFGSDFERAVIGHTGETLLQVCQMNDVDQIEGACEGCMCCSTCHLIFDEATFKALGPVSDDEQDLIDRAAGATDTSRLGCQVRVSKQLEGARIRIPSEFTNQMI